MNGYARGEALRAIAGVNARYVRHCGGKGGCRVEGWREDGGECLVMKEGGQKTMARLGWELEGPRRFLGNGGLMEERKVGGGSKREISGMKKVHVEYYWWNRE